MALKLIEIIVNTPPSNIKLPGKRTIFLNVKAYGCGCRNIVLTINAPPTTTTKKTYKLLQSCDNLSEAVLSHLSTCLLLIVPTGVSEVFVKTRYEIKSPVTNFRVSNQPPTPSPSCPHKKIFFRGGLWLATQL